MKIDFVRFKIWDELKEVNMNGRDRNWNRELVDVEERDGWEDKER